MPRVVPATTGHQILVLGRQRDGCDLRLVAHLGEKESDDGGAEHAEPGELGIVLVEFLSGTSVQIAIAMKDTPSTQRRVPAPSRVVTHAPTAPAQPWLTSVAIRMPRMIGTGACGTWRRG